MSAREGVMNSLEYTAISNLASSIRIVVDKNAGLPRSIFIYITLASPHLVFSGKITVTSNKKKRKKKKHKNKTTKPTKNPTTKTTRKKTNQPHNKNKPPHPSL